MVGYHAKVLYHSSNLFDTTDVNSIRTPMSALCDHGNDLVGNKRPLATKTMSDVIIYICK